MMKSTFDNIQKNTKNYHRSLYSLYNLFDKGSWLEAPEKEVEMIGDTFIGKCNVKILDLGSGVGRNSIPLAMKLKPYGVTVTCVDYLDTAIEKLYENAHKYKVADCFKGVVADISDYPIPDRTYDLIISHSVLMYLKNKSSSYRIIKRIQEGTKNDGIDYIAVGADIAEYSLPDRTRLPRDIETGFSTDELKHYFNKVYRQWKIEVLSHYPYKERYVKNGKNIEYTANFVTIVAKKCGRERSYSTVRSRAEKRAITDS